MQVPTETADQCGCKGVQQAQIHEQLSTTTRRSNRLQICNQDAAGSVLRFATESITEPAPTDPEAFLPDPQDDDIDPEGYNPTLMQILRMMVVQAME